MERIYLDNAATSWPKPPCVLEAIRHWFEELGVDAQRGGSARNEEVAHRIEELRLRLGRLTGTPTRRVILCSGATEAINLFLKGYVKPGMRVWSTTLEHNAVIRPLVGLRERMGIGLRFLDLDDGGVTTPALLSAALVASPPPHLLVLNHGSNVTGRVQDVRELVRLGREAGARTLLDCAQTAGRLPVRDTGADAIALPGHKGLMGPPGVGALCLREELDLLPLSEGGTGSSKAEDRMPATLPAGLEPGTPNSPGLVGWLAGLIWVEEQGMDRLHEKELGLLDRFLAALALPVRKGRLRIFGPRPGDQERLPVLGLILPGQDPAETGMILEQEGIQVRTGFHCAAYVHREIGTSESGTVRISPGPFNTPDQMDKVADLILELAGNS